MDDSSPYIPIIEHQKWRNRTPQNLQRSGPRPRLGAERATGFWNRTALHHFFRDGNNGAPPLARARMCWYAQARVPNLSRLCWQRGRGRHVVRSRAAVGAQLRCAQLLVVVGTSPSQKSSHGSSPSVLRRHRRWIQPRTRHHGGNCGICAILTCFFFSCFSESWRC